MPTVGAAFALPRDLVDHWASDNFAYWMNEGVLAGFEDGTARPDANLLRCEMIAFLNRALGYATPGGRQFADVTPDSWYAQEFLVARQAGYFTGFSNNFAYPEQEVTRAEAASLLCRIFSMTPQTSHDELARFADYERALVVSPARSSLEAMVERGFLTGYPDNTLRPDELLTRSMLMSMFSKIMQLFLNRPGVNHNNNSAPIYGNAVIRQTTAELRNATIYGDLVIAPGAGEGQVTLTDVTVSGRILLMGGGNVDLTNCQATDFYINKKDGQRVTVNGNNSHFHRLLVQSPSDVNMDARSSLHTLIVAQESLDSRIRLDSDPRTIERFSLQAVITLASSGDSTVAPTAPPVVPPPVVQPATTPSDTFDPSKPQVYMPNAQYVITIGSQVYVEATVFPLTADNKLIWSSSKRDVATVDQWGLVTGLAVGSTTITAVSATNPSLSATATVVVEYRTVATIALNNTSLTLAARKTARLTATLFPLIGTKQPRDAVAWFSGDNQIATVDQSGNVRGVAVGKTTVYAYVIDIPAVQTRCAVNVVASGTLIDKITLPRDKDTMTVGEKRTYAVSAFLPAKPTLLETNWWSNDTVTAMVYNIYNTRTRQTDVEVHALEPGQFTLYTEALDGSEIMASMIITVLPRLADDMQLSRSFYSLTVGDRVTAEAVFTPSHAANQVVYWESTHPDFVSISPGGQIWARKVTANVVTNVQIVAYAPYYANTSFYRRTAQVVVTGDEVETIDFSYNGNPGNSTTSIQVPANSTREIAMIVRPTSAPEKTLTFESLDPGILGVTSTGDITASLRGLRPGVARLRVTHDASGKVKEYWVVVASSDFLTFLQNLQASTAHFSSIQQPESFFYYNPDLEYEIASFYYAFVQANGILPALGRENVFYGLINAWASSFRNQPEERFPGGEGRLPREAQAMSLLLRDSTKLLLSLSTASNDDLAMIANSLKNLWTVSEASFDWGEGDYFTRLAQFLFFENNRNTLPPNTSSAVTQILNLNHLLARSGIDPYAPYNTQVSNAEHAGNFIKNYMNYNTLGAAAVIQITKLNNTSAVRASYARRMVYDTLLFADGTAMDKATQELPLLGLGYLYHDLDQLLKLANFKGYLPEILRYGYFPRLAEYMAYTIPPNHFDIDAFLAYRTYSQLFPTKSPLEVITAVNRSSDNYINLLKDLDGRYAVFKGTTRVTEIVVPLEVVRDRNNISWRPTRVALYRQSGKEPLYVDAQFINFTWVETGNLPPDDYGDYTLQLHVAPPGYDTVAIINIPVYVHGNALLTKRDLLQKTLAAQEALTYPDLVAARTNYDHAPDYTRNQTAYMLEGVLTDTQISEGWLEYFDWYFGEITMNKIIESLPYADELFDFWVALRHVGGDLRTRDIIVEDYKLFKFFDIYLQRWLKITINNRVLSYDFLWNPGDFIDLGPLSPREYIIALTKMRIRPGDAYQAQTRPDGFVTDYPLESHRTGLFFSGSYAFNNVNNISSVGEMLERYIMLCNESLPPSAPATNLHSLASQWLADHLQNTTEFTVETFPQDLTPTKSYITENLWEHFRKNSDELLPLLTLPPTNNPGIRLTVMPGIILVGNTSAYTDTGAGAAGERNVEFVRALGRPLLNIMFNLEQKHNYKSEPASATWLRRDFKKSWLENGSVFVFDLPRDSNATPLNALFYLPLRFWPGSYSSATINRIQLGQSIFTDLITRNGWNDELQYLLLEALSLHNAIGYNNPLRLLPQEMGGMMLTHDGIDWKLASDDVNEVPSFTQMQPPLRRLWESRTIFDRWWGDTFLVSQNSRASQKYHYEDRSVTGLARYVSTPTDIIDDYVYWANPPSYISPNKSTDEKYYINGMYRLLGNSNRRQYLTDPRSANFKLLNPPDRWFSISAVGTGDQNYEGNSLVPTQDTRYSGSHYDLPRVELLEQIFYRHSWQGVMSYLSAAQETAALMAMNSALGTNYQSWTEWTLEEWQRVWALQDNGSSPATLAGLANWEWQKLIYLIDDPGFLKEFFVDYLRGATSNFHNEITSVADRPDTFASIDRATRMLDGSYTNHDQANEPLYPAPYDSYTWQYNLPTKFPTLWMLNTHARVGDHAYRNAADNLKLIIYGSGNSNILSTTAAVANDANDALVESILARWDTTVEQNVYLFDMDRVPLNRAWAYDHEAVLWQAYNEVKETDTRMLNLLLHPSIPASEKSTILATYGTPALKRERDAYLFRRTNDSYNMDYEIAYYNYSFIYSDYDTQESQDTIVAFVNSLGTRYGQSLVDQLRSMKLPEEWRRDNKMVQLLDSFFNHDASYLQGNSFNGFYGYQVDPNIISIIYNEFIRDVPGLFNVADRKSGIDFTYTWGTLGHKAVRLDFHDLYHRLEISSLPNYDGNGFWSPVLSGYKNRALHEYLQMNDSFSFVMTIGTEIYRVVTLALTTPANKMQRNPGTLDEEVKRLGSVNSSAYYTSGSTLRFYNTLAFSRTVVSRNNFLFAELGNPTSGITTPVFYQPLLLFTKQAVGTGMDLRPWTISVTELSETGADNVMLGGGVYFMSNTPGQESFYTPVDYVTSLIRIDGDAPRSPNEIYIPELLVFDEVSDENSPGAIYEFSSRLESIHHPSAYNDALLTLKTYEELVLLGYDMDDIVTIASATDGVQTLIRYAAEKRFRENR